MLLILIALISFVSCVTGYVNLAMSSESIAFTLTAKIFGIDNSTNNVATIFMINNQSLIRIQNASNIDRTDETPGDGIIFMGGRFMDIEPTSIQSIRACVLILEDIRIVCQTGSHSDKIINIFL